MNAPKRYIPARILSESDQSVVGRWIDTAPIGELIELLRLVSLNPMAKFKQTEHAQTTLKERQAARQHRVAVISVIFAVISAISAAVSAWYAHRSSERAESALKAAPAVPPATFPITKNKPLLPTPGPVTPRASESVSK